MLEQLRWFWLLHLQILQIQKRLELWHWEPPHLRLQSQTTSIHHLKLQELVLLLVLPMLVPQTLQVLQMLVLM